jgi:hypothetical protein
MNDNTIADTALSILGELSSSDNPAHAPRPIRRASHYPVAWVSAKIKRSLFWLGFCGKSGHVFTAVKDDLHPLVVHDLIVTDRCEEGARCLYYACPWNKTKPRRANPSIGETKWSDFFSGEVDGTVRIGRSGEAVIKFERVTKK